MSTRTLLFNTVLEELSGSTRQEGETKGTQSGKEGMLSLLAHGILHKRDLPLPPPLTPQKNPTENF